MPHKSLLGAILVGVACGLVAAAPSQAQEKVFKSISNEQIEAILKGLGIQAKKSQAKTGNATHFDYERNRYKVRLYNYDGKDLMLDAVFPRAAWEIVNQWNSRAKFTRAVLIKEGDREATTLESNLDCLGGVTENAIKHFLRTFEDELRAFDTHLSAEVGANEKIYPAVTEELLEKILKDLKIEFKKNALKAGQGFTYDFKRTGFDVRLYNYGGKDLMIDGQFKKATLEKVNKWNNTRKFVRAVLYKDYASLESNFDCVAGVSENMVRHFIVSFDGELRDFAKFLDKE